jgi:hypothetical protein
MTIFFVVVVDHANSQYLINNLATEAINPIFNIGDGAY